MTDQQRRVLRSLQTAGPRGVTQVDWNGSRGTPEGAPITRLAARVMELKALGFPVEKLDKRRDRCAIYVLRVRHEALPIVTGDDEPAGLFTPEPANAIFGEAA